MNDKKALGPLAGALIGEAAKIIGPKLKEIIQQKFQRGEPADMNNPEDMNMAIQGVVDEGSLSMEQAEGLKNDQEAMDQIRQQVSVDPNEQETMAPATPMTAAAFSKHDRNTSGSRELLYNLNNKYAKADLDLSLALKVWKEARLVPQDIKDQVRNDVGQRISLAESKILYKIGSQLKINSSYSENLFGEETVSDVQQKMSSQKSVRLTPNVRASIEKVGQNLFRTKRANILWKIDMMEDGENQIPYLVRIDTTEASDEDNKREV